MEVRKREQKKPTNAQLQRRIANAVVHIDRDKSYQSIFFSDRGLRLEVLDDCCVISTGFHRHVFDSTTMNGYSRPYLYTKRFVEIALENDCKTENGYSFSKLINTLQAKEDQSECNIAKFYSWWLYNIFQPLYSIGESEIETFLVYEDYVHNIARQSVILSEKTEEVTNKQFIGKVCDSIKEFTENMEESVLFQKKTDEEVARENMEAMREQEMEQAAGSQEEN